MRDERGYVAILVGLLIVPLIGMAAFAVDVGQWYVAGREAQRAADAAALAGVPHLPAHVDDAFAAAQRLSAINGFANAADDVTVETAIGKSPTQLEVTVSRSVPSAFGQLFGVSDTMITRSAVADYAGPVPLGSPCNVYGNAPDSQGKVSDVCDDVGQFWGNIGSPKADKVSGDAFQNNGCAAGVDQCVSGANLDYDVNGYFYSVTLSKDVQNLVIEAFDPALVHVGNTCKSSLSGAAALGDHSAVTDAATRYKEGAADPYCTGDINMNTDDKGFAHQVATNYTVRDPGPNPWDPLSFPVHRNCTGTYPGYTGSLSQALDERHADYQRIPPSTPGHVRDAQQAGYVAKVFRRWVPLCTISDAKKGTYLVQVKTNGVGSDLAKGHNRFSLRAYSTSDSAAKESIAVSGYTKMAAYANLPSATTTFYLARVPSGAASQILNVELFDVGDSTQPGTIRVLAPEKSGVTFTSCTGNGVQDGPLHDCSLTKVANNATDGNRNHNGKWQTISIPIPESYQCKDLDPTDCWVRLQYDYGSGNQPSDTTSWVASIEGDPVRLIE